VHLVGFTTEIYYDARPCERQISNRKLPRQKDSREGKYIIQRRLHGV